MTDLNSTQKAVLAELLYDGASNKEIAIRLRLSESTVKNYMSAIMLKFKATNRVQLVLMAMRQMEANGSGEQVSMNLVPESAVPTHTHARS